MLPPPRLLCFDVDGTIADRFVRPTVPRAAAILRELRAHHLVRLVSNATSESRAMLFERLRALELVEDPSHLITPVRTAEHVLRSRGHDAGLLLCEEAAREDYAWFREDDAGQAVLLATEAHELRIADLQPAFRRLRDGGVLYALQINRYYARKRGLVTDIGPVAAFLEYASGRRAENLGKPSPLLFETLAAEHGLALQDLVMIGDDAEFDAGGAVAAGLRGVLVRTGKYRPGDERRFQPAPTAVLDSIEQVPAWLAGLAP